MQLLESKYEANKSEYVSVNDLLAEIRNMLPTERQQIEDVSLKFLEWHKEQPPSALCTVHPPAGSGAGYGLYSLPMSEVFEKFYSKTYENGGL